MLFSILENNKPPPCCSPFLTEQQPPPFFCSPLLIGTTTTAPPLLFPPRVLERTTNPPLCCSRPPPCPCPPHLQTCQVIHDQLCFLRFLAPLKRLHVALSFLCVGEHVFIHFLAAQDSGELSLRQAGGLGGEAQPPPFANLPHQIIHDQLYICFALTPLMRLHVALSFLYFGEHA